MIISVCYLINEQEKKTKKVQKNTQGSLYKKADAFLTLVPIFGQIKKRIHFYKVMHLESIHFFDAFSFLISSKYLPVLNIQVIIPLPFSVLADDVLFEKCLSTVDEFKTLKHRYLFDISFENSQNFTNQLMQLGERGARFHVHDIPLNRLDELLKGFLKQYIHIYQLPHDQLFAFMKNDLMLSVVDDLNTYHANLLITDIMNIKDIDHFPSIVDYVSGPAFEKTISLPLPKSA
ncbi:MAG: hypothetical protein NEHIOOID_00075 [Holosporales bacterium]